MAMRAETLGSGTPRQFSRKVVRAAHGQLVLPQVQVRLVDQLLLVSALQRPAAVPAARRTVACCPPLREAAAQAARMGTAMPDKRL
jgi:hypothetical protein